MTDVAQDRAFDSEAAEDVIDVEVVGVEDVHPEEGGTGTDAPVPPSGADVGAQLAEVSRERDEFLDVLQRMKADFANFRSRTLRE